MEVVFFGVEEAIPKILIHWKHKGQLLTKKSKTENYVTV